MSAPVHLDILLRIPLTGRGPSYTCGMLARGMACPDLGVSVVTPRARGFDIAPAEIVQAMPAWARLTPYSWVRGLGEASSETKLLSRDQSRGQAAYIFPDASLATLRELKRRGVLIFREMINCHRGTAKQILDEAYQRIGSVPQHRISAPSVSDETAALELADYIFCPSDQVERSVIDHGIAPSKILSACYGWDPQRLSGSQASLAEVDGPTILFVGTISVRKGAHLLLEYWAASGVGGRLVLAGQMEPTIATLCSDLLARPDVVHLSYTKDVASLYRSADVFAFPTLEEGAPLVTTEACASGLAVLTSPMGAGRIVRHGQEGLVLDPYDRDAWIEAIRSLAADVERRAAMGRSAQARAAGFAWDVVAKERREKILERARSGAGAC